MSLQTISFGTIAKKGLDAVDDGDALAFGEVAGLKASLLPRDQNFYALVGDGDDQFEFGETAHKLGDLTLLGQVQNRAASATADDPVSITAHGWTGRATLGDLSDALVFRGGAFGLAGARDGLIRDGYLNSGDSLTFDTHDRTITSVRFTADILNLGRGTGTLLLDLDGDVVTPSGTSTSEDALLALTGIRNGNVVEIDFAGRAILVNGQALGIDAGALFDAFEAGDGNRLTVGSRSGRPVAIEDLVIETEERDVNHAPEAVSDTILTNAFNPSIPEWLLLRNDSDPDGDTLQITAVSDFVNGNLNSFTPTASPDDQISARVVHQLFVPSFFTYTASDGNGSSADAVVRVDVQINSPVLTGTASDDVLIGEWGVIAPGAGSDIAVGGTGKESFNYVVGERAPGDADFFDGGAGDDTLRLLATDAERTALQPEIAAFQAHLASGADEAFTFESLDLTVRGIEHLEVRAPGAAILVVSGVNPLNMGATLAGFTSTALLVSNVGSGTATDIEVTWEGPFDQYPINYTLGDELGGQQNAVETVMFVAPSVPGTYEGAMHISYFDGEQTVVATHDFFGTSIL